MIFNAHTHSLSSPNALVNVEPGFTPVPGQNYSLGIHPWHAAEANLDTVETLHTQASLPQVKAIGETGLDKNTPAPDIQRTLLLDHIDISESLGKPLILHIVGAYNDIIALRKQLRPSQPWIIHGYRGKPQLTAELLRHGFYLSLGQHFNPMSAQIIPSDRLLVETDTSRVDIAAIAARLPQYDPTLAWRLFKLSDN